MFDKVLITPLCFSKIMKQFFFLFRRNISRNVLKKKLARFYFQFSDTPCQVHGKINIYIENILRKEFVFQNPLYSQHFVFCRKSLFIVSLIKTKGTYSTTKRLKGLFYSVFVENQDSFYLNLIYCKVIRVFALKNFWPGSLFI